MNFSSKDITIEEFDDSKLESFRPTIKSSQESEDEEDEEKVWYNEVEEQSKIWPNVGSFAGSIKSSLDHSQKDILFKPEGFCQLKVWEAIRLSKLLIDIVLLLNHFLKTEEHLGIRGLTTLIF